MIPHFFARRATEPRDDAAARGDPYRLARVATVGVLAIAVVMRLPWPSAWWLNPDEGIYYAVVTRRSFADFWAEAMATAHPPLYFLILRGIAVVSTDFAWLRSVALISGVAAVYAFIALGRELGNVDARGRLTGLLAGLLIAVSPRAVALSQVVRPYMLLLLLLAAALSFLLRFARLRSNGSLVAYAACVCVALMLHYSA
jgi:4-amino-4-deoxy-L-arabinose transferase-like glycosyltransferase